MVDSSFAKELFRSNNLKYYTAWSNFLFYFVILLYAIGYMLNITIIPSWLLYAVIVNIIAVGLVGNCLSCFNYKNIYIEIESTYPSKNHIQLSKDLSLSNFLFHTLPLILSIVVLLMVKRTPFNISYSLLFLLGLVILWLIVPTNSGNIFIDKIQEIYSDPPLLSFLLVPLVWVIFLKLIDNYNTK